MTDLHFSFATNKDFVRPCWVAILSLLEKIPAHPQVTLWLLVRPECQNDIAPLQELIESQGHIAKTVVVDPLEFQDLAPRRGFSVETYFQLLLPEIVDCSIKRILHLDSDLIVTKDPSSLFNEDLNGFCAGAIEDRHPSYASQLGISDNEGYYNGGVMLFNLDVMRATGVGRKTLEFAKKNPEILHAVDQDAFNVIARNSIKRLHPKWNFMPFMQLLDASGLPQTSHDELEDANKDPYIVHFAGGHKPWKYLTIHPHKKHYWDFINRSPWKGIKPEDKSLSKLPRKLGRYLKSVKLDFRRQ